MTWSLLAYRIWVWAWCQRHFELESVQNKTTVKWYLVTIQRHLIFSNHRVTTLICYPPCLLCRIQRRPWRSRSSGRRSDSSRLRSPSQSPVEPTWINEAPPVVPPDSLLRLQRNNIHRIHRFIWILLGLLRLIDWVCYYRRNPFLPLHQKLAVVHKQQPAAQHQSNQGADCGF